MVEHLKKKSDRISEGTFGEFSENSEEFVKKDLKKIPGKISERSAGRISNGITGKSLKSIFIFMEEFLSKEFVGDCIMQFMKGVSGRVFFTNPFTIFQNNR